MNFKIILPNLSVIPNYIQPKCWLLNSFPTIASLLGYWETLLLRFIKNFFEGLRVLETAGQVLALSFSVFKEAFCLHKHIVKYYVLTFWCLWRKIVLQVNLVTEQCMKKAKYGVSLVRFSQHSDSMRRLTL